MTSALAIFALLAAGIFGWTWIDPLVGIAGAVLIATWALGLIRTTSAVLLDAVPGDATAATIRRELEVGDDRIADLHVWRLGPGHLAAIVSVVTHTPQSPDYYKQKLRGVPALSHMTIEVHTCS